MTITVWTYVIVCSLALVGGLVDSIAGGGGLITLPAYLIAGFPPHMASATNKCSAVFGTFTSTARFLRQGKVNLPAAAISAVTALLGSALGARLYLYLSERYLQYVLMVVLPVIAVFLVFRRDFVERGPDEAVSGPRLLVLAGIIGLLLGTYDGFFGPGTGTFLILLFTALARFDVITASGNAKVINLCSNAAAFVTFACAGKVVWAVGLPAAVCGIVGNYIGSGLVLKKGAAAVRPMFCVVLALLFARILYDVFT